ncbi:MAG: hypothetical protein M3Y76_01960 [Chloroflexota bacterium]|nr:hypothetical protein [Chloroflexota bacterium]
MDMPGVISRMISMRSSPFWHHYVPLCLLLTMVSAFFLLDAVLSLRGVGSTDALLPLAKAWTFWPAQLLFPHAGLVTAETVSRREATLPNFLALSWQEGFWLFGSFALVFLTYLLALARLPGQVSHRFILTSTLILGGLCVLIPVLTSQDLFLYIGYARMAVLYHLNPLTTPPTAIRTDPVYSHIYWVYQPSLYGPTWIGLTSTLQWLALLFGFQSPGTMVLLLRMLGLGLHLSSTQLIWKLSGRLQEMQDSISLRKRKLAVLAFAWNPLLLLESCVNAHSDILILCALLLALWLLTCDTYILRWSIPRAFLGAALLLALASGVKLNMVLLVPGLLIYAWRNIPRMRILLAVGLLFLGMLLVLYVPFWQGWNMLRAVQANASTNLAVNSLPEVCIDLVQSVTRLFWHGSSAVIGLISERVFRILSIGLFVGAYSLLCWRATVGWGRLQTPWQLIQWMVAVWWCYCALGSPWFWPWYGVIFFGLIALVASVDLKHSSDSRLVRYLAYPRATALFTFCLLTLPCFFAWGPLISTIPGLPGFHWAYLRGLWIWLVPLLALPKRSSLKGTWHR